MDDPLATRRAEATGMVSTAGEGHHSEFDEDLGRIGARGRKGSLPGARMPSPVDAAPFPQCVILRSSVPMPDETGCT